MQIEYRNLNEVARPHLIRDADLLLYRRLPREPSIVARAIAVAGRGEHYHAAMAAWKNGGPLMCLETRSLRGARAVTLASQVQKYPGRIDVFEANADFRWAATFRRRQAVLAMWKLTGQTYGYRGLLAAACLHLPVVRWFVRASAEDDMKSRRPPFCSHAVALATRAGGVDVVPNLADALTEPADLARSLFYRYRFTLVPKD